jgi:hypothetical protein
VIFRSAVIACPREGGGESFGKRVHRKSHRECESGSSVIDVMDIPTRE